MNLRTDVKPTPRTVAPNKKILGKVASGNTQLAVDFAVGCLDKNKLLVTVRQGNRSQEKNDTVT